MPERMQCVDGMNLIDGKWCEGESESWQRDAPGDGTHVWSGRWAATSQVSDAFNAARAAFPVWAETSLDDRKAVCQRFASILNDRKEDLARLIAVEVGKPLWEARTEVGAAVAKVANSIDALMTRRWTTTEQLGDFMAVTRFRPHGVMFVIGPFNFPAHIPGGHIIPALLAGNTVIFKPSEQAPATGQWLAEAWEAARIPEGVFQLVHGAKDVVLAGVENEQVDGVLFTGSERVGTALHRRLAGKPEIVLALEMGGNNPLVVHGTTDFRGAAITTILSAYLTAGQRCTCARRLIISGEKRYARLLEQLAELIPQIRVGLPLDKQPPFMGTLIHGDAANAMLESQKQLLEQGARAIVPMKLDARSPALVTPGLVEVAASHDSGDCEHFGPLLTVQQADDLDHAIQLANQTQYGLSAGFIGDHVEDFHYFLHRIRAGVVNWNRQTTGASGKLPFGGIGKSGNHHPSGFFAADYCSYPVASLESHTLSDAAKPVPGLDFTSNT